MTILSTLLSVVLGGLLGGAVDANYNGRLSTYINSPQSEAIALFSPEEVAKGRGGWKGEHAGKWLYAASRAYERTKDPIMLGRIVSVADYLVSLQEENGYLGCYRADKRFYVHPGGDPEAMNVDWDTWIIAYLIGGMTETGNATGDAKYLDCAEKLIKMLHREVFKNGILLCDTGQHAGMAGAGIVDNLCDFYAARPTPECRELINECIRELDEMPNLQLVTLLNKGYDVSLIGNGKIYEMTRCLTGLAKAYRLFGDKNLLSACDKAWECIRSAHLTTLGGPWGGINICDELFNRPSEWAPYECTETCSVMQWMHFTRQMHLIHGHAKYANELEKTAYNALLAAQAADGNRWIYYVRTNGWFGPGQDWSCCWSSGMTAVEEVPGYMFDVKGSSVYVNIIGESEFNGTVGGKDVAFRQTSDYARSGEAVFVFDRDAKFTLAVHNPEWASECKILLNGNGCSGKIKDGYICIKHAWKAGDVLSIRFPYELRSVEKAWKYRNAGKGANGKGHVSPNWYNGYTRHYVSFCAGPLVFATQHDDKFAAQNPIVVSREEIAAARLGTRAVSDENAADPADGTAASGLVASAARSGAAGKADPVITVGSAELQPICLLKPYEGLQARVIWLRIK